MPCPHAQGEAHLSAEAKIVVHDDNWKWTPSEKYTWREHEGRGYWRDDKWVPWEPAGCLSGLCKAPPGGALHCPGMQTPMA